MKEVKAVIIATIITCLIIVSTAFALPAQAESRPEFYPRLTIVVSIDDSNDTYCVNCLDKDGNIWSFYAYHEDGEEWAEGDIVNLFMMTIDEIEENDQVIEVYWEGYTENITQWLQMNGWR